MSWKLKLFTGLNAVGWLVVVPILAGALLDPFVDFRGWPGGSLFDGNRGTAQLAELGSDRGTVSQPDRRRATAPTRASRSIVLPGGSVVSFPGPAAVTPGANGPEARPNLQNRLSVGSPTVDGSVPLALRDSASFATGRAPGADRPAPSAPAPAASAPEAPAQQPSTASPPSGNGNVPVRGVNRPVPDAPAPPTKGSGPTPVSEGPSGEEPNAPTAPKPVVGSGEPTVDAPEPPAAPAPSSGSSTPPPPKDKKNKKNKGDDERAVQPPKLDVPGDDDEGHGNGNGGNGNGKGANGNGDDDGNRHGNGGNGRGHK